MSHARWSFIAAIVTMVIWGANFAFVKYVLDALGVACGLVGHALHVGLVFWGINLSTAFSSALVLTSGPLFTLAILVVLGAEPLRPSQVAGTLVAFAGI